SRCLPLTIGERPTKLRRNRAMHTTARPSAMARKPENDHALSAKTLAHIRSLRSQIDKLDLQILKLVNERADSASEIGALKSESSSEVFDPVREEEVLKNVIDANKGPLDEITIRAIFREIISGSRAFQKIIKV